jgi:hypothetical protein
VSVPSALCTTEHGAQVVNTGSQQRRNTVYEGPRESCTYRGEEVRSTHVRNDKNCAAPFCYASDI